MNDWERLTDAELVAKGATGPNNARQATIEMLRRTIVSIGDLKATLHREEVAIKFLTCALVGMTGVLVWLTLKLVLHGG